MQSLPEAKAEMQPNAALARCAHHHGASGSRSTEHRPLHTPLTTQHLVSAGPGLRAEALTICRN